MSVKQTLIYWRDIPSQVIVQRGRKREKAMLSARFQEAIDRAAMRAGKGGSDEYMADWRRDSSALDGAGDLQAAALELAARLEADYSDERLAALVAGKGLAGA